MTTRFSPIPDGTLENGYSNQNVSDITIPPCGLEDVDVALFDLFDKELRLYAMGNESIKEANQKRIPVIFAAGEKWAMLKKGRPLRDKSEALILPLITVMRTGIEQNSASDIVGRGINQQTGVLSIRRKLDSSDREYQNLINKLYIVNQKNVAVNPGDPHLLNQLLSDRKVGELRDDPDVLNSALMAPNRLNNVYETLTLPAPQFFSAKYEVTFWTQYTQQMNALTEVFMSSFLPQGRCFKLITNKGYWFVAYIEESFQQENNFDDMSRQERVIKQKFSINVPAYVLASGAPGVPIPIRRYVSSPVITFSTNIDDNVSMPSNNDGIDYPYLGADDPTLPSQLKGKPTRLDMRDTGIGPLGTQTGAHQDPALASYRRGEPNATYVRVGTNLVKGIPVSNSNGEIVYRGYDFINLETIIEE